MPLAKLESSTQVKAVYEMDETRDHDSSSGSDKTYEQNYAMKYEETYI